MIKYESIMSYSLSVIVPVYNGDFLVESFLDQMKNVVDQGNLLHEVIVVNDGSFQWNLNEKKLQEKYQNDFTLIFSHHDINKGKGATVRTGLEIFSGTHALMLDVDCATQKESICSLIKKSKENLKAFICGSRFMPGAQVVRKQKKWRSIAGSWGSKIIQSLFSIPIEDTQCGAKIFPKELAQHILERSRCNGWAADVEWIMIAQKNKIDLCNSPVVWKDGEVSQVKPIDFVATGFEVALIRMRSY